MAKTSKQENADQAMKEQKSEKGKPKTDSTASGFGKDKDKVAEAYNRAMRSEEETATKEENIIAYEVLDDSSSRDSSPQSQLAMERDKYLRLAAEYDNFRKRSMKELKTSYSEAKADTITKLLPIYDNLERALKMECSDEPFYKGVEMTMTQLTEILQGLGVTTFKTVGEPFDPNRHNAVASIENPELGEKTVAEEYQKGFILGDKVIRFATVVVAN